MATSQDILDNSIVVAPPDDMRSSFASPRSRSGSRNGSSRNRRSRNASPFSESLGEVSNETIEQRYLRQRIKGRPQHDPNQPKDLQVKSILMKTMTPPPSAEGRGVIDLEKEEEMTRQREKLKEPESNAPHEENSSPRLNQMNLQVLNGPRTASSSSKRRQNSADSKIIGSDSLDSGRGEALNDVKGRADFKAAKKIEWLENYLELCEKRNVPMDTPDMVRSKELLGKLKNISGKQEVTAAREEVGAQNMSKIVNPKYEIIAESDQNESDDVVTLKHQLADANREIDKLRLERALLHAQKEIKKLKVELSYGHEIQNEDINIDNIYREKTSPASINSTPPPDVNQPRATISAPIPSPVVTPTTTAPSFQRSTISSPSTPLPSLQEGTTPTSASAVVTSSTIPPADNSPNSIPRRRTNRNTTRLSKIAMKGNASRWTTIAKEVTAKGSESLMNEDELESYREEKRKRKKKKQFIADMEEFVPPISSSKKEINPLIKRQLQSFDFLNFLDSLDGLDGNTPQKPPII